MIKTNIQYEYVFTVIHGKILTTKNLQKIVMVGSIHFRLCLRREETIAHLCLSCSFFSEVWEFTLAPIFSSI